MSVANEGKGPMEVAVRCGQDFAARMGALRAGSGAAGPPQPKRARGFMIKSCKGSTWPSWIPRAVCREKNVFVLFGFRV